MKRLLIVAACVASLAGAGLAGCGGSSTRRPSSHAFAHGGTFTYVITGDPGTLDPQKAISSNATGLFDFAYDTLVSSTRDGRIVPSLASSWRESPRSVTFTIRPGVTCSDGSPVTASVVARNLDDVKDPKLHSILLGLVVPSPDYTVKADDAARTVTIELAHPFGLLVPSTEYLPIVCGKGLRDRSLLRKATYGSGPFVLTSAVAEDHYTLTRRAGYAWGPSGAATSALGTPNKVVLKVVANESTAANLLLSGAVTSAIVNGPDLRRLQGAGMTDLKVVSGVSSTIFNQARGRIGADPAVRKALSMVIDHPTVAKVLERGSGTVARGLMAGAVACTDDGVAGADPGHDPSGAQGVLDAAGWRRGADGIRVKGGRRLSLTAPFRTSQPGSAEAIELIRGAAHDVGIELKPRGESDNALDQTLFGGGQWDVLPLHRFGIPLPSAFAGLFAGSPPPDGDNFASVRNADFQRAATKAAGTAGQAACPIWQQAERALIDDDDIVPVVATTSHTFVTSAGTMKLKPDGDPIATSIRMLRG
jgi:peptide/nickel transport system substrate-binding protein